MIAGGGYEPGKESAAGGPRAARNELRLTVALNRVLSEGDPEYRLTLGIIIDRTGERAFGVLMAFLCLPFLIPVSIPGLSIPFGITLMLLGAQLAIRKHRPWLPARMLRWQLPDRMGRGLIGFVSKLFRPLERVIRPRLLFMQNPVAMVIVGLALVVDGFLLSLPLPPVIPASNAIPAYLALFKILGITEEDGLSLLIGSLLTAAAVALVIVIALVGWHTFAAWLGLR